MDETKSNIKIAAWLGGTGGRVARIVLGAALVIAGVAIGGVAGTIVALIGLVPIGLGMSNRCLISKAIGAPWKGQDAIDMTNS
ncbi:MAG: sugar porter family MFS transporter [Actinobacteria bacterium]|nr:sugar porter family MFS transporter [Actinomycetota bacterium]